MRSDALPVHAHALLEHQQFVSSLARSLLRDEHAAQDVAQETLLTLLTRPPRAIESMRGWLAQVTRNRARSLARQDSRRIRREKAAARPEADEYEAKMHERLALQHQVVEALLGLSEPYKTVVVLAYYEGLSPTEIAKRRNIPAGTVRAQLSRALQMMREKLDAECAGGRSAWSVGLAGLLARSKPVATGLKLTTTTKILAASLIAGGVVAPFAWRWMVKAPDLTTVVGTLRSPASESLALAYAPAALETAVVPEASARSPIVAAVPSAPERAPAPGELDGMLTEAKQIQLLLRARLLTPDRALIQARDDLKALPGIGFARMWQRGALGSETNNSVGLRGAASYLSFATGIQDYDHEPDLGLEGAFRSGFYGGSVGAVVRLDGIRLANLVNEQSPFPASMDADTWSALWAESKMDERSIPSAFDRRLQRIGQSSIAGVVVGSTYLVRSLSTEEHDILGTFEVLAQDDKSATIAWRVLKRWDIPRTRSSDSPDPLAHVPPPPESLSALSTDELIGRRTDLAARAERKILDHSESLDPALLRYAAQPNGGLARIAERGRWDALLPIDGGGAYWSFTQRSNDYKKEAQIELQQGRFTSGFAGRDRGYVLDLGTMPLEEVSLRSSFPSLDERGREAAAFLLDLSPVPMAANRTDLEISQVDNARAGELGLSYGAQATIGHSYLVRSVQTDKQDVLAAFQVLARDEGGLTLAWKILRQQPASR